MGKTNLFGGRIGVASALQRGAQDRRAGAHGGASNTEGVHCGWMCQLGWIPDVEAARDGLQLQIEELFDVRDRSGQASTHSRHG